MTDEDYLTVQEAAATLGISETAVRNALLEDRLPFTSRYGRKLIATTDVEEYRRKTQPQGRPRVGRPPKEKQ